VNRPDLRDSLVGLGLALALTLAAGCRPEARTGPVPPVEELGRPVPTDLKADGTTVAERRVGSLRARLFRVNATGRAPYQFRVRDGGGRVVYDRILSWLSRDAELHGPDPLVGSGSRVLWVTGASGPQCCTVVWLFETGDAVRTLGGIDLGTPALARPVDFDHDGRAEFLGEATLSVPVLDPLFSLRDWPRCPIVYRFLGTAYARAYDGYAPIYERDLADGLSHLAQASDEGTKLALLLRVAADLERLGRHGEALARLSEIAAAAPQADPAIVREQTLRMLTIWKPADP
jgi:hypothetical protein